MQAAHPEAVVSARQLNGVTLDLAPLGNRARRSLDLTIGRWHYLDSGVMAPINTDWADETGGYSDGNHLSAARILSTPDGGRRIYPRRDHMDEYVEFQRPQYWTGAAWANIPLPARQRIGDTLLWDAANFAIACQLTGCQVKLSVTLKTAAAAKRIRWPVSLTGLTRTGWQLLSGTEVVCEIPHPTLTDAAGTEREVEAYIRNGAVEFIADTTNLAYPIVIDPTVDYQTAASADDGYLYNVAAEGSGGVRSAVSGFLYFGNHGIDDNREHWVRFLSVTIPDGSTLEAGDAAYLSYKASSSVSATSCNAIVYGDDAATPTAPNTVAVFWGKTLATAHVHWDNVESWTEATWYNSPDIKPIITELLASYSYAAGAAMQFLIWNNASDTDAYRGARDYDYPGGVSGPKLHIEYTEAGGTSQSLGPHMAYYRRRRAA